MLIIGSYGSVMQSLVLLSAKYRFFAKLPYLGITIYQDGYCSWIILISFLGPVRDVSVAFVIRRGGELWRIKELLSQLILSMRSGMFFFDCNSGYLVLTRLFKCYELNNRPYSELK